MLVTVLLLLCVTGVALSTGLLVSVFQNSPQLQSQLLDEVVSKILPSLPSGKRWHKAYVVGSSRSASIHVITAMLVQMVQVCPLTPCNTTATSAQADARCEATTCLLHHLTSTVSTVTQRVLGWLEGAESCSCYGGLVLAHSLS